MRHRTQLYAGLAVLAIVVAAGATLAVLEWSERRSAGNAPAVARREPRPTLDPARFVGKAALTHQVARNIPDVLDQLYCYCECDKTVGHKSLLSCYTDGHAAT